MTKEQAVREELAFGKESGMLTDLHRAAPSVSIARCEEIVAGAPMEGDEVDFLFGALELDEDSLENE